MDIQVGDIIRTKKPHPCGGCEWEVLRVGIDFRIKCCGCNRELMLPRKQVEKTIKKVLRSGEPVNN